MNRYSIHPLGINSDLLEIIGILMPHLEVPNCGIFPNIHLVEAQFLYIIKSAFSLLTTEYRDVLKYLIKYICALQISGDRGTRHLFVLGGKDSQGSFLCLKKAYTCLKNILLLRGVVILED